MVSSIASVASPSTGTVKPSPATYANPSNLFRVAASDHSSTTVAVPAARRSKNAAPVDGTQNLSILTVAPDSPGFTVRHDEPPVDVLNVVWSRMSAEAVTVHDLPSPTNDEV